MSKLTPATSSDEAATNLAAMKPDSKAGWKSKAVHPNVVLPSGAVISFKIPNLPALAAAGEIPNSLVDLATASANSNPEDIPKDALEKLDELQTFILTRAVVQPAVTPEDVKDLPAEDVAFISELAYRQREFDAIGNHIAGLDAVMNHATFRPLHDGNEDLSDV